ncbi:MAG TPA: tetratricopeptide repeat protein [Devosia sp.]|nr:tetratricopeptide repeat protein [Devosia sp.]
MRRWLDHISVVLALSGPLSSFAMTLPATAQTEREQAALDALFEQLRNAPDPATAQGITDQIWIYWTTPADPILAARMQEVLALRINADFPAVIALLNDIVADYPTYAEAWNQRATIYYLLRNFEQSMADIEKVLELEPRHFGALVGRAVMYKEQGRDDLALKDMLAAMAIHPYLVERAMFPELLEDAIAI